MSLQSAPLAAAASRTAPQASGSRRPVKASALTRRHCVAMVFRRAATSTSPGSFFLGCAPSDVAEQCAGICIMLKVHSSSAACIFFILFIFSPQDISASSRAIFSRAIQNASGQPSDAACLDVLRPVLSILSSWPSSLPAHLLWSDILSTIRTCVEVPILFT
jgi:hypothetical protein